MAGAGPVRGRRKEDADATARPWPPTFLLDGEPARRQSVRDLLASAGEPVRLLSEEDVDDPSRRPCEALAVVALSPPPCPARELERLSRFREGRCEVLAYGPGWDTCSLGFRCQGFLAGAAHLLDCGSPTFMRDLLAWWDSARRLRRGARHEEKSLCDEMEQVGLVGRSGAMVALFRWIEQASGVSDLPALITGETGTGKELVARAIHRLDAKRGRGPFVPVNCAALSPGVAESELFGHRRGSFTGASQDHRGLFRSADGGVLFLDEIADLEPALQGKLLRVLQDSRVLAVGEDRETSVSVRVVAATNKDLRALVAEGRFRLDLYHRLAVLEARVPPLGERRDDIGRLVAHLVEKHGALRPQRTSAAPGFVKALARLDLPGNVRQLENLVRRALVQRADEAPLDIEDLPPEAWDELCRQDCPAAPGPAPRSPAPSLPAPDRLPGTAVEWSAFLATQRWSLSRSLRACERVLLQTALESARGNQSQTARLLGITPRSVYNKLRQHAITR
jgi:DNA-binding NtrC family response regulator